MEVVTGRAGGVPGGADQPRTGRQNEAAQRGGTGRDEHFEPVWRERFHHQFKPFRSRDGFGECEKVIGLASDTSDVQPLNIRPLVDIGLLP